jgi:nitrogen fixation NifU-like protein
MKYTRKVIDYFMHPKNRGSISNADGIGTVTNPVCGDKTTVYIKVEKKRGKDYIKDIKFETLGCAAAIASSSIATELIKGKSLEQAKKLKKEMIIKKLGGLPQQKIHCSLLATDALFEAIKNYEEKQTD